MMSVIVELRLAADDFALGRSLRVRETERVELETMVPMGERIVPYVWVYDGSKSSDELVADDEGLVESIRVVDEFDDRTLYALEWRDADDPLLTGIQANDGQLLKALGSGDTWAIELRFPTHVALSGFRGHCDEHDLRLDVRSVYNPSKPEAGPWFGLTERQRQALLLAVERGYYDIPRRASTVDIAEELGISDQAMTERLRRAIRALVENTLIESEADD